MLLLHCLGQGSGLCWACVVVVLLRLRPVVGAGAHSRFHRCLVLHCFRSVAGAAVVAVLAVLPLLAVTVAAVLLPQLVVTVAAVLLPKPQLVVDLTGRL